jgi:hypothetical protein
MSVNSILLPKLSVPSAPVSHADSRKQDARHPTRFSLGGDTVRAFRHASAALGHPAHANCRPTLPNIKTTVPLRVPQSLPTAPAFQPQRSRWEGFRHTCDAAFAAAVATPLRTAAASGLMLYAATSVAPLFGVFNFLSTLQVILPYCTAAGFAHWLTDRSQTSPSRSPGQRIALGAVCLPTGGALGALLGSAVGLTGWGLLAAATGGAAALAGAAYLAHEAARSPLGMLALLLGLIVLVARAVWPLL